MNLTTAINDQLQLDSSSTGLRRRAKCLRQDMTKNPDNEFAKELNALADELEKLGNDPARAELDSKIAEALKGRDGKAVRDLILRRNKLGAIEIPDDGLEEDCDLAHDSLEWDCDSLKYRERE